MVVIWWLIPVALLIIAILLLLEQLKNKKPDLFLVEPLGLLIKNWRLARYEGDGNKVQQALQLFWRTRLHSPSRLDTMLPKPTGRVTAELIASERFGLLGEQRVLQRDSRTVSVIIGLLEEVSDRLVLTPAERKNLEKLSNQAGEHGFLVLIVGQTVIHGRFATASTLTHAYLGAVLLEPVYFEKRLAQLRRLSQVKLLTVLPPALSAGISEKLAIRGAAFSLHKKVTAAEKEAQINHAGALVLADNERRYETIRLLQLTHRCRFLSALPDDRSLPLPVLGETTLFS